MCFLYFCRVRNQTLLAVGIRIHHHLQEAEGDLRGIKTLPFRTVDCVQEMPSHVPIARLQHKPNVSCYLQKICFFDVLPWVSFESSLFNIARSQPSTQLLKTWKHMKQYGFMNDGQMKRWCFYKMCLRCNFNFFCCCCFCSNVKRIRVGAVCDRSVVFRK